MNRRSIVNEMDAELTSDRNLIIVFLPRILKECHNVSVYSRIEHDN